MNDKLIVTETLRFPFKKYKWQLSFITAKIYLIDWATKNILKSIVSPEAYHVEEFESLKNCYHYHGGRGITANKKNIFIATQNEILVYDHHLKLQNRISNQYFNGIHEIEWVDDKLFVTCAVTDAIFVLNNDGEVIDQYFLGDNPFFVNHFNLSPRTIDNTLDYRIMHKCKQQYHINNVCVNKNNIFAGFNTQGAFVQIAPIEKIIIEDESLINFHNAQFTPDQKYILMNDTKNFCLKVYDNKINLINSIDLRNFSIPINFNQKTIFRGNHHIQAGWLRGLTYSTSNDQVVYLGLSPTCIVAINFISGELIDFLKIRKNIWITVHGIYNLNLLNNNS